MSLQEKSDQALVLFMPTGKRGRFAKGTKILDAARELGVDIDSLCGGRGMCGRCQVEPQFGEFAKHGIHSRAEHVSAVGATEARYAEKRGMKPGRRQSCQCSLEGDLLIDVPPESQVHQQIIRKAPDQRDMPLDPALKVYLVQVREPDMHDPTGDLQRLKEALEQQHGLGKLRCDLHVMQGLQPALRKGQWQVSVAVYDDEIITGVWPGEMTEVYGLAVDVGSTTIAAHLCNLATGKVVASTGLMNPQIRYGEDLMSRVSYSMMNKDGAAVMRDAIWDALNGLLQAACNEAQVPAEKVMDIVLVGNPVMHHLFLGIDPVELGGAPFALASDEGLVLRASEIKILAHPGARLYVLPCIAGHVGADSAAVALAERPDFQDELTFVVDVGTNAEMLLGTKEKVLAASSPTGPAFEGAQISAGQRAAAGAIERIRIDKDTLEPRFRIIGSELWSDEPGFDEAVAKTGITGICGSGIIEAVAEMYLAGVINEDGLLQGDLAERSPRVQADGRTFSYIVREGDNPIKITQNDVRAIQLAKAALYAGYRLLMDRYGAEEVERVVLAGAFGSHIDTKYAMVLGMIPDCSLDKVVSAGNAAGTGARLALVNRAARTDVEALVNRIEKVETALEPKFQEHFVGAMAIPHKVDAYPKLRGQLDMPALVGGVASPGEGGDGRRRRRRSRDA
jgi:uncharacterized 2Fe-2S/4Fe-4S cluster protein (DUF4445 family)